MAAPIVVESATDPRLADFTGLRDPDGRRRREEAEGFFVGEGFTVVGRMLGAPERLRSVLLLPARYERLAPELAAVSAPVYLADREVIEQIVGFDLHRGVLASADRPPAPGLGDLLETARTLVVLEGLNDPENLGAIARTARALGADALLLDPRCADPYARRTVRVSMGEILSLAVRRLDPWPDSLAALRAAGFTVAALTPGAGAVSVHDWQPGPRVALLLGAEGPGLSDSALRAADLRVRIPIRAEVDSLNVGHAAAAALAVLSGRRASVPRDA